MKNGRFKILPTIFCLVFFKTVIGQLGPGGVSLETASDSDCKMWLDAREIQLPDGANVAIWNDISASSNTNSPTQTNLADQPVFRSLPSAGINGNPVLKFSPDRFLRLLSSTDINTSGPYTERTTFLAFRTGTDVNTRQMLWEQGGGVRGLNIYIFNGELYFGAYDIIVDGGDGTPAWVFTFTRTPVQPGTTYIVSHMFDGPTGSTNGTIEGFINGERFDAIDPVIGAPAANVGSLWTHPNAPGLGAVNGDSYNENGSTSGTGSQPFLGDLAEFIAYDKLLNDAERIIVENYLASKYGINLSANDYFSHQQTHGVEVIGLGRDLGSGNIHNNSQARNLFRIEATGASFADSDFEYFLIGHNDGDTTFWTATDAPNNGVSTRRLAREWKVDHTGDVGSIQFTIDSTQLPAKPAGYTKYCLVVDKSGGAVADFNSAQTDIIELVNTIGSNWQTTEPIPDNSYVTLAVLQPIAGFVNLAESGFELSPVGTNSTENVLVELNYRTASPVDVDFMTMDNSATLNSDYTNVTPSTGFVTIPAGSTQGAISFEIVGDLTPEPTEEFTLSLILALNSTNGLAISTTNSASVFTIYDDDNPPKFGFNVNASMVDENAGPISIEVNRSGDLVPAVSVDYQLRVIGGSGTATDGSDYTISSGTLSFATGITQQFVPLTILEDLIDEPNETIILELTNPVGGDLLSGSEEHTVTIMDNDALPTVQFAMTALSGSEAVGIPSIEVILSSSSGQTIQVDYENLLTGSATDAADYAIPTTGTLTFSPGDTIEVLPLFVVNDALNEAAETINFQLVAGSEVNASISGNSAHTYTITDYTSFEWLGAGGVGMAADNIFWYKADQLSDANNANVGTFVDESPNGFSATQTNAGQQPSMNFSGPNGKKELLFSGTDVLTIPGNGSINTSTYSGKDVIVGFSTGSDVTSRQIVYEQGGSTRGLSIYIQNDQLFYHVWNNANDNGANSAWGSGSTTGAYFVNSGTISANTDYVATLHFRVGASSGTLEGFLNGASVGSVTITTPSGVPPILYAHGDAGGIGGRVGSTRFHDGSNANAYFQGAIQEVIHYSNAPFHDARRMIVENYVAANYAVSMAPAGQLFSPVVAATYGNEVAGIGESVSGNNHLDGQGTGMVRVNSPVALSSGDFFLWGHDQGAVLFDIPPAPESIPNIDERLYRVWRAAESGDIGGMNVTFYLNNVPGFNSFLEAEMVLLIDKDQGDFSNSSQITAGRSYNASTGELTFANVQISDGEWFTVGRSIFDLLPVTFSGFEVTNYPGEVVLDWTTASEHFNDYFSIERSSNGFDFEQIGTVKGAGFSTNELSYSFIDTSPLEGISYYRIKQTDFNGKFSFSEMKSVNRSSDVPISVFPNPTKNEVNIVAPEYTNTQVEVIDLTGKTVENIWIDAQGKAYWDASEMKSGIYLLRFNGVNRQQVVRLSVQ